MSFRSHMVRVSGLFLGLLFLFSPPVRGQEAEPVVHAVLFYSPTCPHCHEVISTFLVPLQNEYGSSLVILGMDTSQPWANDIFWAALEHFEVPEEKWAVPFLIVDETLLVGGEEIPGEFRAILDQGLEQGGIDLPNLPALLTFMEEEGLLDTRYPDRRIARQGPPQDPGTVQDEVQADEVVSQEEEAPAPEEASPDSVAPGPEEGPAPDESVIQEEESPPPSTPPTEVADPAGIPAQVVDSAVTEADSPVTPADSAVAEPAPTPAEGGAMDLAAAAREMESMTMRDRFNQDPTGNALAVVVLILMLVSLVLRGVPSEVKGEVWPGWVIPALVVLGMGVAGYLSYIEVTQVEAVCGPVGDCNTVNQSPYATLFGFLPVGVLGLMGYTVILALWGAGHFGEDSFKEKAHLGLWAAVLFGTLFSVYLTFLEPFVIGASCAWCLTSAANMTLLLWATHPLAARAWPGGSE
jgi:uncharacterized membrane protein